MRINSLDAGSGAMAGYTLRSASDAYNPYDGFNVCHYTGDAPEHVGECRRALARRLGVGADALVIPRQTHSVNVATVTAPCSLEDVDGLVTNSSDVVLCINTADCLPVLFNDPVAGVVGACHGGWRGVAGGIVQRTVEKMTKLGADASRIHVAMGPCICVECFEVGEEVAAHFAGYPGAVVRKPEWVKPHVDLAVATTAILTGMGVDPHHISAPPQCTRCQWQELFSARRMSINSGRMLSFIKLT